MRVVIDSNIALDFLGKRDFDQGAIQKLFALAKLGEFNLWMSTAQANDLLYILTQGRKPALAAKAAAGLKQLNAVVHYIGLTEADFLKALDSGWSDLEDACVYQTALSLRADAIITRNTSDFEEPEMPVLGCAAFFEYLEEEQGISYEEIDF